MKSSNLALTTNSARTNALAPWNLFSALLYMGELQSAGQISRVLADYGIAVHTVSSVPDADQIMRSNRLDLVICDLDLPETNQLAYLKPFTA